MLRHRGDGRATLASMHHRSLRLVRLAPFCAASWLALSACSDASHAGVPTTASIIDDRHIDESSGLARSQRVDDLLWTLNDSGGAAELYGLDRQGHRRVTLAITGATNLDWEDLASYRHDGKPYLLIGDMGDNQAVRQTTTYYRVEEPQVAPGPGPHSLSVRPDAIYTLRYPDGPRDAESLAVDGVENKAYVLSKRNAMPRLYRFDLGTAAAIGTSAAMEALGQIQIPRVTARVWNHASRHNWVTTMDFDDGLSRAYVGGLLHGYFYDRADGESWAQALAREPRAFDLPDYPQIEAATFERGSSSRLYITSEQLPAPLARLEP